METTSSGHDLPVELVLRIVHIATCSSQAVYRSLVLVSRGMRDIVRLECLRSVPVTLTRQNQIAPFIRFVSDPEIGASIRYLWLIVKQHPEPAIILALCPNIESLACKPSVLIRHLQSKPLPHCVQLTLHAQKLPTWQIDYPHLHAFSHQIRDLHLMGPVNECRTQHFLNLQSFSISSSDVTGLEIIEHLGSSFNTERIAFVVHSQQTARKLLDVLTAADAASRMLKAKRLAVVQRPRRWTEMKLWIDRIQDNDLLWKGPVTGAVEDKPHLFCKSGDQCRPP
ncbi:hypothetical protein C8J56DRAFT_924070 [Mycena floridula]|nr:hypothetical protein C8J56DRAFT_924070 [Mycena floridula]